MEIKKIFSITLIICLIFTSISIVHAKNEKDNFATEKEYAEKFLLKMGYQKKLVDPIPLFNLDGEIEAISFTIQDGGYLIINYKNLKMLEISFDKENPYSSYQQDYQKIYNGIFEYYVKDKYGIRNIKSGKYFDVSKLKKKYKENWIDKEIKLRKIKEETKNMNLTLISTDSIVPMSIYEEYRELKGTLRTWSTSRYCGVDAVAILLMYFDDYYTESFVSSTLETATALTDYLVNEGYIADMATSGEALAYGDTYSLGIDNYLYDNNLLNSYTPETRAYSYLAIKTYINGNKPVITGTESAHPDFDNHWIITHGYCRPWGEEPLLIINDGFGTNDMFVTADATCYDNIVYIK
ncbi:hypothetical protein Y919_11980 [Caloranaerobacter azorensis H53214]|uniref:Uncharacterized protein n=1 Tax=Caloranaerobacter azorensis H53214 TaxID=1156417 RepID=A0A096DJI4_9FIRM|nr:hypothetical protein [Caloranaerobacter azorensis]KGG79451.1 hypothetical protein Y919_11980 [Caloranaerobacter azorensis H53214]